jgi:polysaccharide export outer membrane protein
VFISLKVLEMKKKTLVILCLVFVLGAVFTVLAQNPAEAPRNVPASAIDDQGGGRYLLGPGDILDVRVFGNGDLNSTVEVDADGNISSLPFIEAPIRAKCRNEKEIQASITEAYSKYLLKPRVSVRITERRSRQPAVIFGAVRTPQRVDMRRRVRLHELLATSGGITQNASGTIQIMHTEPEMCAEPEKTTGQPQTSSDIGQLEVYQIVDVKTGQEKADPFIRPGDVVIVTEGEPIYITGAVGAPHEMTLKDGLTLHRAIMMSGGVTRIAKTNEVHIYRVKEGKIGSEDLKVNYDAIRKGTEKDILLKAYDIVDVRQSGQFSAKVLGDFFLNSVKSSAAYLPTMILF